MSRHKEGRQWVDDGPRVADSTASVNWPLRKFQDAPTPITRARGRDSLDGARNYEQRDR